MYYIWKWKRSEILTINLIGLKLWIEDELKAGHRSKASKINKVYEKYFNKLSLDEQNQTLAYDLNIRSRMINEEFFEK